MTTSQLASRLVELCRQGDFQAAQRELFADDAVSIEPYATPAFEKETKGLDAILEKADRWEAMVQEMHGMEVSEPLVAANSFAVTMSMQVTIKEQGFMDMKELCVYQVKDGKIISEQFFM